MKQRVNMDEREISIRELWWYVLSKWKWMVAGLVLGALVLGGLGYLKDYKSSGQLSSDKTEEELLQGFSDKAKQEITSAVRLYKNYTETAEEIDTGYVMMLDPGRVYKVTMQYLVDTDYVINLGEDIRTDYTNDILAMYGNRIKGQELRKAVIDLGIDGLQEKDLEYLILYSYEGRILEVTVYGQADDCTRIADTAKEYITNYYDFVCRNVGEHKISLLNENYIETVGASIRSAQSTRRSDLKINSDALNTALKDLSEEQKAVYDILINHIDNDNANSTISISVNKKYVLLGGIAGIILAAVIALAGYMFGRKFNSAAMAGQIFNVPLLGKVCTTDNYFNKKRARIGKTSDADKQLEHIIQIISGTVNASDNSQIYLSSSRKLKPESEALVGRLSDKLKQSGLTVEYGVSVSTDADVLKQAVDCGNIVLIEQLDYSDNNNITDDINLCDNMGINILGMIAII